MSTNTCRAPHFVTEIKDKISLHSSGTVRYVVSSCAAMQCKRRSSSAWWTNVGKIHTYLPCLNPPCISCGIVISWRTPCVCPWHGHIISRHHTALQCWHCTGELDMQHHPLNLPLFSPDTCFCAISPMKICLSKHQGHFPSNVAGTSNPLGHKVPRVCENSFQ